MIKFARWLVGRFILVYEFLFSPKGPKRSAEEQNQIDAQTKSMALYEFQACPFCVKVRMASKRLGLKIERRDAKKNAQFEKELTEMGGKRKVPCLRIDENNNSEWMYESSDIVAYLEKRFSPAENAH